VYKEGRRDGKMNQCNLAFHKRLETYKFYIKTREQQNKKFTTLSIHQKPLSSNLGLENDLRHSNALQSIVEPSMPRTSL
jgi:hypothetical protein